MLNTIIMIQYLWPHSIRTIDEYVLVITMYSSYTRDWYFENRDTIKVI